MKDIEAKQLKWEELDISNDFLFGKVMQDAELCKELLQRILSDLYGKGRYMYTFENICKEDSEVMLNDGAKRVFLNADGKNGAVSEELKAFLDYVAGKPSEDIFVKKLETAVEKAKKNREWRREYMTLLMRDRENQKIGKEIGKIFGAILMGKDLGLSDEEIITRLQMKFNLTEEQASAYLDEAE